MICMHFETEQLYTDNTKALDVVMGRKENYVSRMQLDIGISLFYIM